MVVGLDADDHLLKPFGFKELFGVKEFRLIKQ